MLNTSLRVSRNSTGSNNLTGKDSSQPSDRRLHKVKVYSSHGQTAEFSTLIHSAEQIAENRADLQGRLHKREPNSGFVVRNGTPYG
jgi:hypothetical protein